MFCVQKGRRGIPLQVKEVFLQQEGSCGRSVEAALAPSQLLTAQNVLHPSSAWKSGKLPRVFFPPPGNTQSSAAAVLLSRSGLHMFKPAPARTRLPRLPPRSAPLFHTNQAESHPRRNGVKSTFVGQVGSPLRAQPDA